MALLTADSSTVGEAAQGLLDYLRVIEPPISVELVLAGLGVLMHPLPSFDLDRLTPQQRKQYNGLKPVRGLLSPAERRIYVSDDLSSRQMPWLVFHEAGHAVIGWHQQALYLDNEYRLSQSVRDLMEKEANEFAGHIQFLGELFAEESRALPFGLCSAIAMAERFDSSYESGIRRYVEGRTEDCICLVCRIRPGADGIRQLAFRYFVRGKRWYGRWALPKSGDILPDNHPVIQLLNQGHLDDAPPYTDTYYDVDKKSACRREVFSNGHNVFILLSTI